jgi:putative Ca2+/H+ antiporter (TMEM165/GDT1 family)
MSLFDPAVAATTFALILPVELPDKTFFATLVLSTRYRPLPVWIGVVAAFAVQSSIAVVAGGLLAQLPHRPVLAISAVLFAIGSILLFRGVGEPAEQEAAELRRTTAEAPSSRRMALTSFWVLFAAEWGDLSQLLTAGLAARYNDPVGVFVGSWGALAVIAAIAVIAGRGLLRVIPLHLVRRIAATLFAALAVITALEAAGVFG